MSFTASSHILTLTHTHLTDRLSPSLSPEWDPHHIPFCKQWGGWCQPVLTVLLGALSVRNERQLCITVWPSSQSRGMEHGRRGEMGWGEVRWGQVRLGLYVTACVGVLGITHLFSPRAGASPSAPCAPLLRCSAAHTVSLEPHCLNLWVSPDFSCEPVPSGVIQQTFKIWSLLCCEHPNVFPCLYNHAT